MTTDTIDYLLYIKATPFSQTEFKIGISAIKHTASRLGTYQNAFGPSYRERFETVWLGPEQDIRELERLLKIHFRNKIAGTTRGYTEWVTNIDYDELCDEIQNKIELLGVLVDRFNTASKIFEEDVLEIQNRYILKEEA